MKHNWKECAPIPIMYGGTRQDWYRFGSQMVVSCTSWRIAEGDWHMNGLLLDWERYNDD